MKMYIERKRKMKCNQKLGILPLLILLILQTAACGQTAKDVPLETVYTGIKEAYGGDYRPDGEIPQELLENTYGLKNDMYTEIKAEMSMISIHPDVLIVVKAAEGQADNVEAALNTARDNAIQNTLQYPMNIPKTNATKVLREGNIIAYLTLGANGDFEDAQSDEARTFAENEAQKGADAFQKSFE